jgi:hypothetical protein
LIGTTDPLCTSIGGNLAGNADDGGEGGDDEECVGVVGRVGGDGAGPGGV